MSAVPVAASTVSGECNVDGKGGGGEGCAEHDVEARNDVGRNFDSVNECDCGKFKIDEYYQPPNWNWRICQSSPARHRAELWGSTTSSAADPSINPSLPWEKDKPDVI